MSVPFSISFNSLNVIKAKNWNSKNKLKIQDSKRLKISVQNKFWVNFSSFWKGCIILKFTCAVFTKRQVSFVGNIQSVSLVVSILYQDLNYAWSSMIFEAKKFPWLWFTLPKELLWSSSAIDLCGMQSIFKFIF